MSKWGFVCLFLGILMLHQGGLEAQEKKADDNVKEKEKEPPKVILIDGKPIQAWIDALRSDNVEIRRGAAQALAKARANAKAAAPVALEMLKSDDAYNRALGAYVLQYIEPDPKVSVPPLVMAIGDKDRKVREAAAFAVASAHGEEAIDVVAAATPQLAALLGSDIADVRGLALYVLANARKIDGKAVTPALVEVIKNDKVNAVRKGALEALRNCSKDKGAELLPLLFEMLKEKDPEVRRAAAGTLIVFKVDTRKNSVPMLRDLMLEGSTADIRGLAAYILANIQPNKEDKENLVAAMTKALDTEKNDEVKTQIRQAILEIDPITAEKLNIK